MGRVEQRLYRRRKKRAHLLRLLTALLLMAGGVTIMLWLGGEKGLVTQRMAAPTSTPIARAWDQSVQTREVTLPEACWYAIQTGVFSTEEAAAEKAGAYSDRGAPGMVIREGEKWRVFIACYGSAEEAASVRKRLEETQGIETYQYAWCCPELRLRLSGMAGQLDLAEAGLTLMQQIAEQLRDSAILMDAGQISLDDAGTILTDMDGRISLWRETTCDRFGKPRPALIEALLAFADGWHESLAALRSASSTTGMSAEMKRQGMKLYQQTISLRAEIGT